MPLKQQVSPTLPPISKACQLPRALEVPLLPGRGRCCSPWCSAGHKKLSWGGHGDQERAATHPRVTSMEKGQPSPGRDLRCQGLGGFVAQTLAGEDPGPPRELHTTCPFSPFPFLPSRSEPPDLQGLHNSVRKPPSRTPSVRMLPREKPQLCWAGAEDKGTAKHLPARAFAPLLLSPAEAPRQQ